jgi:acyl-CoA thioesterase FadM
MAWVGRSSFGLQYRVEAADSDVGSARLVADGSTVQVFYDVVTGKVVRMPPDILARIGDFEGRRLPNRPTGV